MRQAAQKRDWIWIGAISVVGLLLRFTGFPFEGVDYQECLSAWTEKLKAANGIHALSAYTGDYNYPYITILYFLTYLPIPSLYSIKLVSVLFDFLEAGLLASTVKRAAGAAGGRQWIAAYALVLWNPLAVINSGYLAQCESIWTALGILAFYLLVVRERPGLGMFAFGLAIGFKLQAVFILPILLICYFLKKKFSILNVLWIPVAVELLCIPAIIGGCGWDSALGQYLHLMGEYPFLFYYYPNIWTFFQNAPYYVFGTVAVAFAFVTLLLFAVLMIKSGKTYTLWDYVRYAAWIAMTCVMLLPCMHERYNYMAEMLLPVAALSDKRLRIPAAVLILTSLQCIGQQFLDWYKLPYYVLAVSNIAVYFYFTACCMRELYGAYREKEAASC